MLFNNKMKFIDLFCGIGGFHQALGNLGYQCVLASDIDPECRKVYQDNYKLEPCGDINEIVVEDIPDFDILCAGFPCQPFSKAGSQKGFSDTRGNLFFSICKIIKHHKPRYLLLENVRNLASHDSGNTWKVIQSKISELGYYTYSKPVILNTLYFGVPQSRERVIIMCKRKDLGELKSLPNISRSLVKPTSLETIIEDNNDEKYKLTSKNKETEEVWNNFLEILMDSKIKVPKFPIWTDWWDSDGKGTVVTKKDPKLSEEENLINIKKKQDNFYLKYKNWIDKNREFYNNNKAVLQPWLEASRKKKLWTGAVRKMEWQVNGDFNMKEVLWSPRGSGVRIKNTNYSPTLVAMTSMIPIYGPKSRMLTPRECLRLQSFPDSFKKSTDDNTTYKQAGNAVNIKVVEACARFLILGEALFK